MIDKNIGYSLKHYELDQTNRSVDIDKIVSEEAEQRSKLDRCYSEFIDLRYEIKEINRNIDRIAFDESLPLSERESQLEELRKMRLKMVDRMREIIEQQEEINLNKKPLTKAREDYKKRGKEMKEIYEELATSLPPDALKN